MIYFLPMFYIFAASYENPFILALPCKKTTGIIEEKKFCEESMKNITIGLVAHVDAGKTTLTEQMLYLSGAIRQAGSVDKGTAQSDFLDVEKRRGISVRSAAARFLWDDMAINLIDTPGHADFTCDVERSLRALDAAVLLVSAPDGVSARTRTLWEALTKRGIPVIIFVNKTDRVDEAGLTSVRAQIKERLSRDAVFADAALQEQLAELDESILDATLNGEELSRDALFSVLARLCAAREAFPVLFGSAMKGEGIEDLLFAVTRLFPVQQPDLTAPFSALVYKIENTKLYGRTAHVRVYAGRVGIRGEVTNARTGEKSKVTRILSASLSKRSDVSEAVGGDICVLCGLNDVRLGDVLGDPTPVAPDAPISQPLLQVDVVPKGGAEVMALAQALSQLCDEDPSLAMYYVRELSSITVSVTGLIQLEVLGELLKTRFDLEAEFCQPTVIYKETPARRGEGFVAYTAPKPCWAVMKFAIDPLPPGSGVVFESVVNPNQILPRYQNQIRQALAGRATAQGPQGWEVTDVKFTLIDGSSHQFHTHPLDFILATPMAVMQGLTQTGTLLLEPIMAFTFVGPEELSAKVLGELLRMRGTLENTAISPDGEITITGRVPLEESVEFPIWVASATSGRGRLDMRLAAYEPCPLGHGRSTPYRGVHPLDTAKYILSIRGALTSEA